MINIGLIFSALGILVVIFIIYLDSSSLVAVRNSVYGPIQRSENQLRENQCISEFEGTQSSKGLAPDAKVMTVVLPYGQWRHKICTNNKALYKIDGR